MAGRNVVAIGTAAGGFEALRFLPKGLTRIFQLRSMITIHVSFEFHSASRSVPEWGWPFVGYFRDRRRRQKERTSTLRCQAVI
jgi:two-component system, chemotaxis family, protein-glutamate methylesterase/glutaminase